MWHLRICISGEKMICMRRWMYMYSRTKQYMTHSCFVLFLLHKYIPILPTEHAFFVFISWLCCWTENTKHKHLKYKRYRHKRYRQCQWSLATRSIHVDIIRPIPPPPHPQWSKTVERGPHPNLCNDGFDICYMSNACVLYHSGTLKH